MNGGTELRKGRREMTTGNVAKTSYGDMLFALKIDMPGEVSEDEFKKKMVEYGNIIAEAFSR